MSILGGFGSDLPVYFGATFSSSPAPTYRTPAGELPVGRFFLTAGGERVDQIAYRVYGLQSGVVEALFIANPGLAALGFELPANVAVVLPELKSSTNRAGSAAREVALWG